MKPYVVSAVTGFLAPLALPLPPLPEDWPSWIQYAIAIASGTLGPVFTWIAARALKAIISTLRRRAATKRELAKILLEDGEPSNDARAIKLLQEADLLYGIADGLMDKKTQEAAFVALRKEVEK